jgi:hypothetical protein
MTDIIRLDPHDPLPEAAPFALVIRRFGEDDPNAIVTEIDFMGSHPTATVATGRDGVPMAWEDAVPRHVVLRRFMRWTGPPGGGSRRSSAGMGTIPRMGMR